MDLFTLISSSFAFSITFCLPSYPSSQFVHSMHKELFLCQFLWSNLLSLIIIIIKKTIMVRIQIFLEF